MKDLGMMNIYKTGGQDSSNFGLSSKFDRVRVIEASREEIDLVQDNDIIFDTSIVLGKPYLRAYDAKKYLQGLRPMFGGCFVYTCNGTVPNSGEAIKLFDRCE